jgi:hypothetical protein
MPDAAVWKFSSLIPCKILFDGNVFCRGEMLAIGGALGEPSEFYQTEELAGFFLVTDL